MSIKENKVKSFLNRTPCTSSHNEKRTLENEQPRNINF
jgi:hypothetical protein